MNECIRITNMAYLYNLRHQVGNFRGCFSVGDQATKGTVHRASLLEVFLQWQCSCNTQP